MNHSLLVCRCGMERRNAAPGMAFWAARIEERALRCSVSHAGRCLQNPG